MSHGQTLYEIKLFGLIPLLTYSRYTDWTEDESESDPEGITGGSAHNFSLATNDEPSEIQGEPWDRFGFQGPR